MRNLILMGVSFLLLFTKTFGQKQIAAENIILRLNAGESIELENVDIKGKLDLTELASKKLQKNKSNYIEYKSIVKSKLRFKNCRFFDDVLAYKNSGEMEEGFAISLLGKNDSNELYIADFEEDVVFENCTFDGKMPFKYSTFYKKVQFSHCTFNAKANFKYAIFKQFSDFSDSSFRKYTDFKYAKLMEDSDFFNVHFTNYADFKYASFYKRITFKSAIFDDYADFKYADFKDEGNFLNTKFRGIYDFKYSNGKKYLNR